MSAYVRDNKMPIKSKQGILDALKEMGFSKEHIIVADNTHLRGYQNDVRAQTADIVLKKEAFKTSSNDFGFKKTATGYDLIISEFDSRWNAQFKPNLLKAYLSNVVKRQLATPQGSQFKLKTQEQVGNKVTVTLSRKAAGFSLGG